MCVWKSRALIAAVSRVSLCHNLADLLGARKGVRPPHCTTMPHCNLN
jgi:hypothetical protein